MTKIIYTSNELWLKHAPDFNFELNEEELLKKALEKGFVRKVGDDQYEVNKDY